MKPFELLSAIAFFVAWKLRDIYFATWVLNAGLTLNVAYEWFKHKKPPVMALVVWAISMVMGTLTLLLHDASFIKLKPTLVYGLFALLLFGSHFVGSEVLLARLGKKQFAFPQTLWPKINAVWAVFFALSAVLNAAIAHWFSEAVWMQFKLYGFTLIMLLFMLGHWPFVGKYLQQGPQKDAQN